MGKKRKKLFVPGQLVTWADDLDETLKCVTEPLGQGPFKIHSVECIPPDACQCGGSFEDQNHEYGRCPYNTYGSRWNFRRVRESVGHAQLVTIDDGTGNPRTTEFLGKLQVQRFSGAYFRPI